MQVDGRRQVAGIINEHGRVPHVLGRCGVGVHDKGTVFGGRAAAVGNGRKRRLAGFWQKLGLGARSGGGEVGDLAVADTRPRRTGGVQGVQHEVNSLVVLEGAHHARVVAAQGHGSAALSDIGGQRVGEHARAGPHLEGGRGAQISPYLHQQQALGVLGTQGLTGKEIGR
ncbi:hypothetical protein [Hymenobacter volaticus]|uniref:hypothetical protein n=1 Tax=Hymenobacter volaticus TaxID=2932254 RepID=UPI0035CAD00B